jgi:hypothetical protein
MNEQDLWISEGRIVPRPKRQDGSDFKTSYLLEKNAMVRISFSQEGALIEWVTGKPNWSSLMLSQSLITALPAPYKLKYFSSGWFTESHETVRDAIHRIEALMFNSDVKLSDRAYISKVTPRFETLSDELRLALETGIASDECSIVCVLDTETERNRIEHVGERSLIGQIWGRASNSFALVAGNSYDRAVTPYYFKAAKSGKPRFDHVMASMVRPDGERHWYGYHRVIIPELHLDQPRVRVVSQLAPVDIQLL